MDRMQLWRESNSQEPCINILFIPFILSKEGGKTGFQDGQDAAVA
jgi:hypothetical protein